jgi:hypothetical protein
MFPKLFARHQNRSEWQLYRAPFFPQPTIDGSWTCGSRQTWCRRREDGQWQYKQDANENEYCRQRASRLVPDSDPALLHPAELPIRKA